MSAPEISRRQAWCKLAILIADGLPDPKEVNFHRDRDSVYIDFDTAEAVRVWAERFGLTLHAPHQSSDGKWIHGASSVGVAPWFGYYVSLNAYVAGVLAETVEDDMASVRAIADLPPGGKEVAGSGGDGPGPATAPGETLTVTLDNRTGAIRSPAEPRTAPTFDPGPVPDADGDLIAPVDVDLDGPVEDVHEHTGGVAGGPGENEAWCACGLTYAGLDTHAEAVALVQAHIAAVAPGCGCIEPPAVEQDPAALDQLGVAATPDEPEVGGYWCAVNGTRCTIETDPCHLCPTAADPIPVEAGADDTPDGEPR